jgi:hypothetical protein
MKCESVQFGLKEKRIEWDENEKGGYIKGDREKTQLRYCKKGVFASYKTGRTC